MIVEICGLTYVEDASGVNAAGPDWAGLVFHPASRRRVTFERALEIRAALDPRIETVGVFVDSDPELMSRLVDSGAVGMLQVHGCSDECFRQARDLGVPVIRTYVVRSRDDVEEAACSEADRVMLDAGMGSGETFDWDLLEDARFEYILSGGLDPGNVGEAVRRLRPAGVDVSSGVETGGRKDPAKMESFVCAARGALRPSSAAGHNGFKGGTDSHGHGLQGCQGHRRDHPRGSDHSRGDLGVLRDAQLNERSVDVPPSSSLETLDGLSSGIRGVRSRLYLENR